MLAQTHRAAFKPQVLIVCDGNLCRSPMAEHLLRQRFTALGIDCQVLSAGIRAQPGRQMHPHAARALHQRNIDTTGWRTHAVDADRLSNADLILTVSASQRRAVYDIDPQLAKRTFRLLSFSRMAPGLGLLEGDDSETFEASLNARAASARSRLTPVDSALYNLKDPLGGSRRPFNQCAAQLETSMAAIAEPFARWRADPVHRLPEARHRSESAGSAAS